MSNGESIEPNQNLDMPEQYPYNVVKPVLEAWTLHDAEIYTIIYDIIINTPETLKDYRILDVFIQNLGDTHMTPYLLFRVLKCMCMGKPIEFINEYDEDALEHYSPHLYHLPKINQSYLIERLKDQFDPKGNQQMASRLKLVATIAREAENDWYLTVLKTAKGGVRKECISALQYSEDNLPILLELAKTEKKKAKDIVHQVLASMNFSNKTEFWREALKENPQYSIYLKEERLDSISDLLADVFRPTLEQQLNDREVKKGKNYLSCTANKTSDKMLGLYQWILEQAVPIRKKRWSWLTKICSAIIETLVSDCPEKMVVFLNTLPENHKKILEKACFCVDLLTCSADEVYEKWHNSIMIEGYITGFENIELKEGHYYYIARCSCEYDYQTKKRELKEPLDERWFDDMMANHDHYRLSRLIPRQSQALCQKVGAYFQQELIHLKDAKYIESRDIEDYIFMMHYFYYDHYEDIMLDLCKKDPSISEWTLESIFLKFRKYVDAEFANREAKKVYDLYKRKTSYANVLKMFVDKGFVEEEV